MSQKIDERIPKNSGEGAGFSTFNAVQSPWNKLYSYQEALHYASRHMSWLHCMWGVGTAISPYILSYALTGSTPPASSTATTTASASIPSCAASLPARSSATRATTPF